MSASFRKVRLRVRYDFSDARCIEAKCWAPGMYQHRGATMSGSRNTGDETATCLNRAYHGCPADRGHDPTLATERKAEGWRLT